MKLRRIVPSMIALLLVCSLPVSAFAAEYDLAEGSVTVIATESGQTVTHGSNAAVPDDRGTDKAAVEIQGEGDVVIELDGSNTVQSDWNRAGVEKNTRDPWGTNPGSGNGNLTITDENETHGSLKATGGATRKSPPKAAITLPASAVAMIAMAATSPSAATRKSSPSAAVWVPASAAAATVAMAATSPSRAMQR